MELRAYLREVWRYLLVVLLGVAAAAALGFLISSTGERVYTAEARVVVTAALGSNGRGADNVLAAPSIGQTYAVLATTRPVLLDVIERAGLSYDPAELLLRLSVTASPETPFVVIEMSDPSPATAARTANAVADILVELASTPATGEVAAQDLLSIVERAVVPNDPSGPRVLFNTILAAAAALVAGLAALSVGAYLRDDRAVEPSANP
jgi:capsular polysaccharide biosynthesis protein